MRQTIIATGMITAMMIVAPRTLCAQGGVGEYEVKAAYLFKLGNYIRWPEGQIQKDYVIGVLGDLPPAASLSPFVGAQIQRASAKYNYLQSLDEMSPCHLLFVSGKDEAAKQRVRETASRLGKKPVVIVCEVDGGLQDGAMISFVLVGDRIKFDVDLSAAKEVGIDFDARMLRIARNVVQ